MVATLCHHVAQNVTCEDDLRFLVNVCGDDAVHAVDNMAGHLFIGPRHVAMS
jgi:hypothetical protein